jgi:segregation and condensation protein B
VTTGRGFLYHSLTSNDPPCRLTDPLAIADLARRLEAVLLIAAHPVSTADLAQACVADPVAVEKALRFLDQEFAGTRHGFELREVAGGFTFVVARDCEAAAEAFAGAHRPDDLSPALLETLSVVAYLQPTTRAEVARVRGVSSEWALSSLEERGLVEECGRADTPGSPILFGTTSRFLTLFGLRGLDELPPLDGFAPGADDVEELRQRLVSHAERRRQ